MTVQTAVPQTKPAESRGDFRNVVLQMLSTPAAPFVVTTIFLTILAVWSALDHLIPMHDAAWHSIYSNSVKGWLSRPRGWSLQSLNAILCMQPNYPAGAWFLNGSFKLLLGDSLLAEHCILGIHLCILNAATWVMANALTKDRAKATLSLIFLDSTPLILFLQHVSFIDLPHTALFASFFCALSCWWQKPDWKKTLLTSIFFAFYCASKQIAVFYGAPILAVMALTLILQKRFSVLAQLTTIGAFGAAALSTWIVPNHAELTKYTQNRSALAAQRIGLFAGLTRNFAMTASSLWQGFSPLMSLALVLNFFNLRMKDVEQLWIPAVGACTGILLINSVAFFNLPEARYFGPVMVPMALFLAAACVNFCERGSQKNLAAEAKELHSEVTAEDSSLSKSKQQNLRGLSLIGLVSLCIIQALLLCFQKTPVICYEGDQPTDKVSKVYKWLGVLDPMINTRLSYVPKGDPWKQEWLFNFIEQVEGKGRPVYLSVLPNSPEFNQGTMVCMAHMRKPCVFPTSWRCTMPDVSDSFNCSDKELHFMQWVVEKTGPQYCRWFDERSRQNYEAVLEKLRNKDNFTEAARKRLPDGTELVLYQNNYWKFNRALVTPELLKPTQAK